MLTYLWIALGGAIGSVLRFAIGGIVSQKFGETFPWGTLVVNISGSFLIGFLGALTAAEGSLKPQTRAFTMQFFIVGICGGYTTFSSFSLQTLNLVRSGELVHATGNVLASVVLCMVAVWLGFLLGSTFNSVKGS